MPVMNGLEFIEEVKSDGRINDLTIIAISSNNDEDVNAKFLKQGANDYIKKPFSKEELYCRVENSIELLENIRVILNSANRDFLTGLYNRRYFYKHINEYISEAEGGFQNLYIAMIDIDHFKNINDTYGHNVGDKAIEHLAEILRSNTKEKDMVSRFGGEEFCVALLTDSDENALSIFERIRINTQNNYFVTNEGDEVRFTISIGLAKYQSEDDINEVISKADSNLYEAKDRGRNNTVFEID